WYVTAVSGAGPLWEELPDSGRARALATYDRAFQAALIDEVAHRCGILAGPTGDDRDLSHLQPDQLTAGDTTVFAGPWLYNREPDQARYAVGYIGVFTGYNPDGDATFTTDRATAEAITARRLRTLADLRIRLAETGLGGAALDRGVEEAFA